MGHSPSTSKSVSYPAVVSLSNVAADGALLELLSRWSSLSSPLSILDDSLLPVRATVWGVRK